MKTSWILASFLAACAAMLPLAGCRERQVPDGPAAITTGTKSPAAEVAVPAIAMAGDALQAAKPSPASCSFDSVDMRYFKGDLDVDKSHPVQVRGWLSNAMHKPAGEFRLVLEGESSAWSIPAHTGVARPDVSDYFHEAALATSGFDLLVDLAPVPAGTYSIMLVFDADGGLLTCDAGKRLQLQ
jgi:hypothetical protein